MARKVFNSPTYCKPCVVPIAHKLLRPTNWVFLDGQEHVAYRKGLNGLFTRQALDIYLPQQEEVYRTYFDRFIATSQKQHNGKPTPFMPHFRELMCAVSCRTFVGHYIAEEAIQKIADEYYRVTAALDLVNFPIILPFTRPWYGKKAADLVLAEFSKCSAKAKVRMRAGGDVTCILDGWVKSMIESETYRERKAKGQADEGEKPAVFINMFTDFEISQTLFTFLFASQDATSSATTWLFQLMADNPEMLNKVRDEAMQVKQGDADYPLSVDLMDKLKYTRAVVKETLRYRPPVLMVPYLVKRDFQITDNYTAKKGMFSIPCRKGDNGTNIRGQTLLLYQQHTHPSTTPKSTPTQTPSTLNAGSTVMPNSSTRIGSSSAPALTIVSASNTHR